MWNIISWNTLYREYEEKYHPDSFILKKFSNEKDRINSIIKLLLSYTDNNCIICLQECSNILLEEIQKKFKNNLIFYQNIRNNEFLITITPLNFEKEVWSSHPSSNGYLVVKNGNFRIINTHLIPQEYVKKYCVLDYIMELPENYITVVAGDFNENWATVNLKLSRRFVVPKFGKTYKKWSIDHIILDKRIESYKKINNIKNILSDHNAIKIYF